MSQSFQFDTIGTAWEITSVEQLSETLKNQIRERTEEFDKNYSRFREDSLVTQWAREAGEYNLPSDANALFAFYKKLYDVSAGLVTPLIGKTMEQAGYDADYSLKAKQLTSPPQWQEAISVGPTKLIVKHPVLLDFGAAGKGYLVDIIAHLLYTNGVDQFCVNAGGDMLVRHFPQTIGLEDPDDTARVLGTVEVSNGALCASAGNRRAWGEFHHIINPQILRSVERVKATWVRADTALLADGVATALFFVSPDILLKTFAFEYAMIENDDMTYSHNFKAQFFTE